MPAEPTQSPVPLAEIAHGPSAFEMFLDRNQKNLVILAILLVIATAAYVIYQGVEKGNQESAGADLYKAKDLPAYQAVIKNHADTNAAKSAMLLLADSQWADGQQDAAIETLKQLIATGGDHPALPSAKASLGAKLMSQGKAADAAKVFQDLIEDPNARFIAPYALICLGDIAQAAGDTGKAEETYSRVKTEYPESQFVSTANQRSTNLKAKPPVEIEPPPAPEPAAAPETTPPAAPLQVTPAEPAQDPKPAVEPAQDPSSQPSSDKADAGKSANDPPPAPNP